MNSSLSCSVFLFPRHFQDTVSFCWDSTSSLNFESNSLGCMLRNVRCLFPASLLTSSVQDYESPMYLEHRILVGDYYGSCWVRMVAPDSSLSSAIATGNLHACKVTRDSGSPLPTQRHAVENPLLAAASGLSVGSTGTKADSPDIARGSVSSGLHTTLKDSTPSHLRGLTFDPQLCIFL